MDEYPDPDEEFDLQHADELELLNEIDEDNYSNETPSQAPKNNPISQATTSTLTTTPPSTKPINEVTVNGRKRLIEDLFGDIDDLLYEHKENNKRLKVNDVLEADLALIEHILELRKAKKEAYNFNTNVNSNELNSVLNTANITNLSLTIPSYSFVEVTRNDNVKIYVRCHSELYEKEQVESIGRGNFFASGSAFGAAFSATWSEAQVHINKKHDTLNVQGEMVEIPNEPHYNDQNTKLWVESYKPKRYLELLSDEGTNRAMLRWIKLWDKVVFHRQQKLKTTTIKNTGKFEFPEMDEDGRPHFKVALLCGPPGLGKTTLAHMVARHAGYNVIEINASDDRSTAHFKQTLENATQMQSLIDQNHKPNCVVFDEIDGAPQNSIEFLVKFITGTKGRTSNNNKGSKKKGEAILKRPIICICNDAFVPALRPLRQIAYIINFPQTSTSRLAERLMEIACRERIKTDLGAMLALAQKSNNDIRTCLMILHFFKRKTLYLSDIHKTSIGLKDTQKGLFATWQDILQIDKKHVGNNNNNNKEFIRTRTEKVLKSVKNFGDYLRLSEGIFENYPKLKMKNLQTLEPYCLALDWFELNDLINKQIYTNQDYCLMEYLCYSFVVWHFVFASILWQKIQYPSASYAARMKHNKTKSIIQELLKGMPCTIQTYLNKTSLIMDVIPLLKTIITPTLRPINLHLYTNDEKVTLNEVVSVMIDYNLNYVQERSPEGNYVYKLDPAIDQLGFEIATVTRQLTYANKQLLAKEIELQRMRRFDNDNRKLIKDVIDQSMPNYLQKLNIKDLKAKKMIQRKDFFGRIIEEEPITGANQLEDNITNDIWFQYKEGYNNAVRKSIKIKCLK